MDHSFTEDQLAIREAVAKVCAPYDDAYWLKKDQEGGFPHDFHRAIADAGWIGIMMPPDLGGAGLGITEGCLMMQAIAESGGGLSACTAIHINVFGPHPVVKHGTPEQRQRMLTPIIKGDVKPCFGITEPNAGLDTTRIQTRAEYDPKRKAYIVHGQKIWTSTAQVATKVLLLTRTTPIEKTKRPIDGLTLFFTDFDRRYVEVREIEKMGRHALDSNQVFYDGLPIPEEDRIGEEGKGFKYLLDGLIPDRLLVAAESVSMGRMALKRATEYAKERIVFDRPIGKNQAIQHPLAESWCKLEAADLLTYRACSYYDKGKECGPEANAARFYAAEAGFEACKRAIFSMGGMGYAKEFHVERYFREMQIYRIAPITGPMVLSYIAERVLGLPKSY
ncbi:MAG: acyl-CoA dehydrogenase family protein [Alphaproteobacteria bacterium]